MQRALRNLFIGHWINAVILSIWPHILLESANDLWCDILLALEFFTQHFLAGYSLAQQFLH